mgnify:CR=1 FL=1
MKQYLLFDLDGTLTDPMVGITSSVQYALEKFGIHVKYLKDLIPFIGPPLDDCFMDFLKKMPGRQWNITESILHQRESLRMRYIREFQKC